VASALSPSFDDVLSKGHDVTGLKLVKSYKVQTQDQKEVSFSFYENTAIAAAAEHPAKSKNASQGTAENITKTADDLTMIVSTQPFLFKVRRASVTDLLNVDRAHFIKNKQAEVTPAAPAVSSSASSQTQANTPLVPSDDSKAQVH
jgi:hypothetical protein